MGDISRSYGRGNFAPIKDTPGFTASDQDDCNDEFTAITTTEDEEANDPKPGLTPNQPPQPMNDPKPITENQVTTITTANDRPDPPGFSDFDQDDLNKKKKKQATPPPKTTTTHEINRPTPGFSDSSDDNDDDQFVPIPLGMFDIDDEFTAITTTEDEEVWTTPQPMNDPKPTTENQVMIIEDESNHNEFTPSNDYYDNIDHKILRNEYEGTIVFEADPSAPTTTVTNKKKKKQKVALPPELRGVDDNPIVIPPTNTRIRPTPNTNTNTNTHTHTKKTRMPPKDRQVPVISNNNTNKKKKKKASDLIENKFPTKKKIPTGNKNPTSSYADDYRRRIQPRRILTYRTDIHSY